MANYTYNISSWNAGYNFPTSSFASASAILFAGDSLTLNLDATAVSSAIDPDIDVNIYYWSRGSGNGENWTLTGPSNTTISDTKTFSYSAGLEGSTSRFWFYLQDGTSPLFTVANRTLSFLVYHFPNLSPAANFVLSGGLLSADPPLIYDDPPTSVPQGESIVFYFHQAANIHATNFHWRIKDSSGNTPSNFNGNISGSVARAGRTAPATITINTSFAIGSKTPLGNYTLEIYKPDTIALGTASAVRSRSLVASSSFEVTDGGANLVTTGFTLADLTQNKMLLTHGAGQTSSTQDLIRIQGGGAYTVYHVYAGDTRVGKTSSLSSTKYLLDVSGTGAISHTPGAGQVQEYTIKASNLAEDESTFVDTDVSYVVGQVSLGINVTVNGTNVANLPNNTFTMSSPSDTVTVGYVGANKGNSVYRLLFTPPNSQGGTWVADSNGDGWDNSSITLTHHESTGNLPSFSMRGVDLPKQGESKTYSVDATLAVAGLWLYADAPPAGLFHSLGALFTINSPIDYSSVAISPGSISSTGHLINSTYSSTAIQVTGSASLSHTTSFTFQLLSDTATNIKYTINNGTLTTYTGAASILIFQELRVFADTPSTTDTETKIDVIVTVPDGRNLSIALSFTTGSETYTLIGPYQNTVNEGDSFNIALRTANVANGNIPYTITGITADDLNIPLSGNFALSNNEATFTGIIATADSLTEGTESFTLSVAGGKGSITINIVDTSIATEITMNLGDFSMDEGVTVNKSIQVFNFLESTIFWKVIDYGTTTLSTQVNPNTGSISLNSDGEGIFQLTSVADSLTETTQYVDAVFYPTADDRTNNTNFFKSTQITILDTSLGGGVTGTSTADSTYGLKIYNTTGNVLISPKTRVLHYSENGSIALTNSTRSQTVSAVGVTPTNAADFGLFLDSRDSGVSDQLVTITRGTDSFTVALVDYGGTLASVTLQYYVVRY